MPHVKSFQEWLRIAIMLDYLDDVRANWKQNDASNIYDYLKTRAKTGYYKHLRSKRDIKELLRMLRQDQPPECEKGKLRR